MKNIVFYVVVPLTCYSNEKLTAKIANFGYADHVLSGTRLLSSGCVMFVKNKGKLIFLKILLEYYEIKVKLHFICK